MITYTLSSLSDSSSTTIPKRGEKDFEPNPTEYQADVLTASRQAMHNALSHPRIHNQAGWVVAYYAPEGPTPPVGHVDTEKNKGRGVGVPADCCVVVPIAKGSNFKSIGYSDRWNRLWLLPEEALLMIERGNLDIRWPTSMTSVDGDEDADISIPMSLQAAYACFLGRSGLTLERYTVFTSLKRNGYSVLRAPGWDDSARPETSTNDTTDAYTQPRRRGPGLAGILACISNWLDDPSYTSSSTAAGPLIGCGIRPSYSKTATSINHFPR